MLVVAVLDVGSTAKTGWWRSPLDGTATQGHDVDELCSEVAADLRDGRPVALGFEAPLWIPFAREAARLGKARPGEHPAWSAGAGATVLAYGLQQMTYVLHRLLSETNEHPPLATLDPKELRSGKAQLLVWEAFVFGLAKDRDAEHPHISDARAAGEEFERRWESGEVASDLGPEEALSLAGLALVASGLRTDVEVLTISPTVVRAPDRA